MTNFNVQLLPDENKYCLQFETSDRDYFNRMKRAAESIMDDIEMRRLIDNFLPVIKETGKQRKQNT